MNFLLDEASQINDLLNRIGVKLQLNKTRKERVETSYKAICSWIEEDDEFFGKYKLQFYSQGSYKIDTTVKPLVGEEYDLDFVLEIKGNWQNIDAIYILDMLEKRLKNNDTYKDKVERKNRCVRINYANEFHIDILPAISENICEADTNIKVPDMEIKDWTDGNPKGFAKWFEDISSKYDKILLEKRYAASVEDLPEQLPYEVKDPLKRIVQLMKRFRDIYYKDKTASPPRSIIITTLGAMCYNGEVSEYDGILKILNRIKQLISNSNGKPIEIWNPINKNEKFSEKWEDDLQSYREFCEFINDFYNMWVSILKLHTLEEKSEVLKRLFGENISKEAIKEQAEYINEFRKSNRIAIDTNSGMLRYNNMKNGEGNNLKVVPKNTFYGE
ncbi:SMODS domain-containing nucleotidyltransferase [Terrisporobacter sp.]